MSRRNEPVEVSLDLKMDDPRKQAVAFWQGEYEEDSAGNQKEVWIWLPRSQIEFEPADVGETVEVTMPEWLAMEKELI